MKHANAVREAKSREELNSLYNGELSEYGMYSEIFDRSNTESVARYLNRGMDMPSVNWTKEFVQAGGTFDSCGSWGIHPQEGIKLEALGVPAEFAGEMLSLLGRADYDYTHLPSVYAEGVSPKTRAEFHACARGIERQVLVQAAQAQKKSTMRLGWMNGGQFARHIAKTSAVVAEADYHSFNGVSINSSIIDDDLCLKNPVFANWVQKRPTEAEMSRRFWHHTSVGPVRSLLNQRLLSNNKIVTGRKISSNLCAAKVANMWFVWNPEVGFQRHIENPSLKEAVRLWENRSKKGEPRPLSLNDVRNDISGTAGFCLAGTKAFLKERMPFVYSLIETYTSWNQIPAEITSTKWEVDFKVFKGYPIP